MDDSYQNQQKNTRIKMKPLILGIIILAVDFIAYQPISFGHYIGIVVGFFFCVSFYMLLFSDNNSRLITLIGQISFALVVFLTLFFDDITTDDILERLTIFIILYNSFTIIDLIYSKKR